MSDYRIVYHAPGEIIEYETIFEENPYLRTGVPSKKGTVERIDYSTSVYEDGKTYNKTCYVYLPFGYDQNDKSKKYNVLYFQHGNFCEPTMFAIGGNKPMFDMLFESGELDPCIIVFVSYYMDPLKESKGRANMGFIAAGDGLWPYIKALFYKEVVHDIIPAVEGRFNTYCEDTTAEGIKATRDHRGFCGYSRGCATTWYMINHDLEYFRWFSPMSGTLWGDIQITEGQDVLEGGKVGYAMTDEERVHYITDAMDAHPELPIFIYATGGGPEDSPGPMKAVPPLVKDSHFSYGLDPVKNNFFFCVSDYYHTDYLVPYYLWNSLKIFFKGV